jgi:PAS domain-containing protein
MLRLLDTASADARDRVLGELTLRAGDLARTCRRRDRDAVLRNDPRADRATVEPSSATTPARRDRCATPRHRDLRPGGAAAIRQRQITQREPPVRADVQQRPASRTPQTVGEVEVESARSRARRNRRSARTSSIRWSATDAQGAAAAGALGRSALAVGSRWPGGPAGASSSRSPRSSRAPIASRKATTRGRMEVGRRDELGELQAALERMRQKLRQTTINKNYLTNVLGSMTDAVFVTSPDGVIRMANQSACKLLAWARKNWSAAASSRFRRTRARRVRHAARLAGHARDRGEDAPRPDHPGGHHRFADHHRRSAVPGHDLRGAQRDRAQSAPSAASATSRATTR